MIFKDNILKDQVALVTGGGSGIGFGIAECLSACGARVAVASRDEERVAGAAERLRSDGSDAAGFVMNVRSKDSVQECFDQVMDRYGRLDILVNNAAGNFYAPSADVTVNGWKAVLETDLDGTFYCCQSAFPIMQAQRSGRIVSISMTLHYRGWPKMAHATAAKAGVDALTRTLALEWAEWGITVNAVAPGPIPTEGVRKAFAQTQKTGDVESLSESLLDSIPLGRWGTPEDVGSMVTYLASPAAAWVTGSIFVVDGGSWMARA